ncbi:MAG: sugar transferase [Pseudomonadota bacterium]
MKTIETDPAHAKPSRLHLPQVSPFTSLTQRFLEAPVGGWTKRTLDLTVSLTMLIVFSPLIAGLALLVSLSSPGPVFYAHWRIGYRNRPFRCLKLRTMRTDGDAVLQAHLERDPEARREWEETRKLRDDPRVTAVGHVLRKLSLDELPQLLNVIRGEMSLVGPRPVPSDELQRYGRSRRFYLRARPGITGLWQVSGRNTTSYARRVAYDRSYVTQFSTARDIAILAQTVPAALRSSETS